MVSQAKRIAVVGWGSISPLGNDPTATWQALINDGSGIQTLQQDWSHDLPSRIAGCVDEAVFQDLGPLLRRRADRLERGRRRRGARVRRGACRQRGACRRRG